MTRTFEFDIWEDEAPVILVQGFPDFETWEEDTAVIVVGGTEAVIVLRRRVCEF